MRIQHLVVLLVGVLCSAYGQLPPGPMDGMAETIEHMFEEMPEMPEGGMPEFPEMIDEDPLLAILRCHRAPLDCALECIHGRMIDDEGCQICECMSEPVMCAIPMCADPCEYGYADNEYGCMTCMCNEQPEPLVKECSKMMCRMFCDYGFEEDEHGCEICRCRDQPKSCSDVMCMMFCEYGFEKNEEGCDICRCRDSPLGCHSPECAIVCENGFEKDLNGCPICLCKEQNLCVTVDCAPMMSCKQITPLFGCMDTKCDPVAVCRPISICELHGDDGLAEDELDMLMHHLEAEEEDMIFPGPAKCSHDGAFQPKQCIDDECFCVDDRGVMQRQKLRDFHINCLPNITKTINLAFQLKHDLDDNDLDGALNDIEALVRESVGPWLGLDQSVVVTVQVLYLKPGQLMVQMTIVHDGLADLASTAHHFHRQMRKGRCNLEYKHHVLEPMQESFHAKHHYETVDKVEGPRGRTTECWLYVRRHHPIMMIVLPIVIPAVIILIIITVCLCKRRKMTASYQFKHKKMENMDNFKKNLILSSEWEKPELVCKDEVKINLADDPIEKKVIA